ncbi:hypothetical protein [Arthrospiribacter ruber]|nr:hypothetical protein [Arthrospiribacter ruber]
MVVTLNNKAPKVKIGDYVVVGAVVTRDVLDGVKVIGVPAKVFLNE